MQLVLKCTKKTEESGRVVVRLEPGLNYPREGDAVSGSIFLTTNTQNAFIGMDYEIVIDIVEEEEEQTEPEEEE